MDNLNLVYFSYARRRPVAIAEAPIPFCELTIVLKGSFEYFVDRRSVKLSSGDAVYIPENSLRARRAADEEVEYVSFNFLGGGEEDLPIYIKNCLSGELRLELALCEAIAKSHHASDTEKATSLLSCILLSLRDGLKEQATPPLVTRIIEYLHANMAKKITLDDIGRHTFFSPVYCDSLFRREMGRSIIDYLLEMRVESAKGLLIEGILPLKKIAENVGIGDYNYFSRVFKKRTGYTPVQYRKMIGK